MGTDSMRLCGPFLSDGKRRAEAREEPSRLQTPQGQADHAHLALDGKTIRATTSQPHPVHQLECYEVATGIVLWHGHVQAKENKISAVKPLLRAGSIRHRTHSHASMPCIPRGPCAPPRSIGWEGHTSCAASDNEPALRADIADLLEDRLPDRRRGHQAETSDKAHGRLEHRELLASPDLA